MHQYCSLTLSMATIAEIRLEAFRHALRLPLGSVLRRGPTEIVARITRDTAELAGEPALPEALESIDLMPREAQTKKLPSTN